jgi:hypothetical protein
VDFNEAIKAHSAWKMKLREAISAQSSTLDVATIAQDDCCALGKWLHSDEFGMQFGALPSHAECIRLHADFHKNASKVAAVINSRQYKEADKMLGSGSPYSLASNATIVAIGALKQDVANVLSLTGLQAGASGAKLMTHQKEAPLIIVASGASASGISQLNAKSWPKQLIAVASITAELSAVVVIAKEIALAAANAKAIAFRAGDKAKGFKPITDFINELAKDTISKTTTISELALVLFQITVNEYRKEVAYDKIEQVTKLSRTAMYALSMQTPLDAAQSRVQDYQLQFKQNAAQLSGQLEEVMRFAQTARTIAIYSRIEAAQAGEYLQSLQTVAESVDNAAQAIHDNVQRCIMALSIFRQ